MVVPSIFDEMDEALNTIGKVGATTIHELPELMERLAAVETEIYNIRLKLASILCLLETYVGG